MCGCVVEQKIVCRAFLYVKGAVIVAFTFFLYLKMRVAIIDYFFVMTV